MINVYYRRSTDNGATWGAEVLLNDDATTTRPVLPDHRAWARAASSPDLVRPPPGPGNNLLFDYYSRVSLDGGMTWQPSVR